MPFSQPDITPELAEFLGIMVGDGNIYASKKYRTYRIVITGHSENDFNYLTNHVSELILKLFGRKPSIWKYSKKRAIGIALYSKQVVDFLLHLGLVSGKKSQIVEIPKIVLEGTREIKASFLRGVADTDFCVAFRNNRKNYPIITCTTSSRKLAYQLKELLKEFSITSSISERKPHGFSKVCSYQLNCYCMRNFTLWMDSIGFKNENHISRIKVWRALGKYPAFSSLQERLTILNKLNE